MANASGVKVNEPLIYDFVNRDQVLDTLRSMVLGHSGKRIAFLVGPLGMGKTYLLKELEKEIDEEGSTDAIFIELSKRAGRLFTYIIDMSCDQLGEHNFAGLIETMAEVQTWSQLSELQRSAGRQRAIERGSALVPHDGSSGGVQIGHHADISGTVIGGHLININYILRQDSREIGKKATKELTRSFRQSLTKLCQRQRVVFLFDDWDMMQNPDMEQWLRDELLTWILDESLSKATAVISQESDLVPDLEMTWKQLKNSLAALDDRFVRIYFHAKKGIPEEKLSFLIPSANGHPKTMEVLATTHKPKPGQV